MIETGKVLQQRYRIDKQIGQGGMGAVYVATDERFGSIVAIKETLFMDDNYRKAIEREARLLNSLKHAALPRVTDHFIEEHGQFLVMEYISGEDLFHALEENGRPFSVEQVLTWADQLLEALDFLHTQVNPVIHRDIKPQNLKVAPNGQIILLDFGLAKGNPTDAGNQTAAKSIFGYSRNYASLEPIQGTGTDPRSDLYSLAATLYHLLTRTPPEDALTRAMALLSHQPDPLVPANGLVPDIPGGVAGILQKALSLNAAQRPSTASEMRTMFREYERYADLATGAFAAAPLQTEIFSQRTKLMPGSTVQHAERQTDIKTEVLPGRKSQVTALKSSTVDTESRPKRRSGLAAAGLTGLLLAGSVLGGAYLYDPTIFVGATENPEPVSSTTPAEPVNASSIGLKDDANSVMVAPAETQNQASADSNAATAKVSEPAKNVRTSSVPNMAVQTKPDEIIVDGETVYMGKTKITPDGTIETPDHVIDETGITPRTPTTPNVRPVIPPIDMRYMTPRQRRRLQEILRRNRVTMMPSPTPQN
ncbi:MAG: serine/threonine-protein kinase [Acidobacteriota bacterium]